MVQGFLRRVIGPHHQNNVLVGSTILRINVFHMDRFDSLSWYCLPKCSDSIAKLEVTGVEVPTMIVELRKVQWGGGALMVRL